MIIFGNSNTPLQNVVLDGLEFTEAFGKFTNNNTSINGVQQMSNGGGAALAIEYANTKLKNLKLYNNTSERGLYISLFSDIEMDNIDVYNNRSNLTSAMYYVFGKVNISNINVRNNIIGEVGASMVLNYSNFRIQNSEFKNNIGKFAAGIELENTDTFIVNNVTFESNTAVQDPKGSIIIGYNEGYVNISNSKFINNNVYKHLVLINDGNLSVMHNNLATHNKIEISNDGGCFNLYTDVVKFYNNTVAKNKNGCILSVSQQLNINDPNIVDVRNNIILDNIVPNNPDNVLHPANLPYSYSIIQDKTSTLNNNLNALTTDVMFINNDSNYLMADYRLKICSPLINAGDTTGISNIIGNVDLDNLNRYFDRIDIGAYEKQTNISNGLQTLATLTTSATNSEELVRTCEEQDWTYYTTSSNLDSIVFAIKWGANTAAKDSSKVYIKNNNQHTMKANASNDTAQANMMKNWYIDLNNTTLSNHVGIKFFFQSNDTLAINNEHQTASRNIIDAIKWYALDEEFDANTHLTYNNLNNGNFETLNGTVSNVNGLQVIQFDSVTKITSGVGLIRATKEPLSTNNITNTINWTLYPNPAHDNITLSINSTSLINTTANILDVAGRIIAKFELTNSETTIDVSNIASGIYIIKLQDGSIAKFTKN